MDRAARAALTAWSAWPFSAWRTDWNAINRAPSLDSRGIGGLNALEQVKILTAAARVAREQQVGGYRQQPVGRLGEHRSVDRADIQWRRHGRVGQKVRYNPVSQQSQRPVRPPGREEVTGRTPGVTYGLEPFGRPQLELLLAGPVPGVQLGAQQLAYQMVIPEAGLLIVERHQEQVGGADGAQQRGRIGPAGDGRARISGQLAEDGGV